MMKPIPDFKIKFLVLAALVCQLFNTNCSRKLHPESSAKPVEQRPNVIANNGEKKNADSPVTKLDTTIIRQNRKKDFLNPYGVVTDTLKNFADEIIEAARKFLGVPHCMGGTTMKCIDCSGLVLIAFGSKGIILPHSAQDQSGYGTMIKDKDSLIKGDLVFFKGSYKTNKFITHSGIYTGDNSFIHTSSGSGVTITSLDDSWWRKKFVFGKRILK